MPNVFFTADQHFNHVSLVEKGWRPGFASMADHNEALVTKWNETVRPKDVVWVLGDFALGSLADGLALLPTMHGEKHLIAGNHDRCHSSNRDSVKWLPHYLAVDYFETVQSFARRKIAGKSVLLSHFPYEGDHTGLDRYDQYRLRDEGLWLLHGHVHDAWRIKNRQFNVGVDVNNFAPVSLEAVAEIVQEEPCRPSEPEMALNGAASGSTTSTLREAL